MDLEEVIICSNYVGPSFSSMKYIGSISAQPISLNIFLSFIFLIEKIKSKIRRVKPS